MIDFRNFVGEKIDKPVMIQNNNSLLKQYQELKDLKEKLNEEGQIILNNDIKYLEWGINGEKHIEYELMNSHIPMYIIHDLRIEYEDCSAQIDFLVITPKVTFIIECKNMYGDIAIDSNGNFSRIVENDGKKSKFGIYSPISQCKRHLRLIKRMYENDFKFPLKGLLFKSFDEKFDYVVVVANDKSCLYNKYADNEHRRRVIKCDKLVDYIISVNENAKFIKSSSAKMKDEADYFLEFHKNQDYDALKKYEKYIIEQSSKLSDIQKEKLRNYLKRYRYKASQIENIPPYYVYTDEVLERIVEAQPKTTEDLLLIKGLGEIKVNKYGKAILKFVKIVTENI